MDKENKENIIIPAKKKAWKPIMGAKTLRRKKLSSRPNSIVTDDQEIDLPKYEKIRLKNITEKESLLNKVKKSALAIKPKTKSSVLKKVKFEVEERKIYHTRTMVWIPSHGSSS